jgi:hypothetical protein
MTETAPPITGLYPPWNLPTFFVENVANLSRGNGIVKFYFMLADPPVIGNAQPTPAPVCQIVMPSIGFAAMTVFFQQQLELMMQRNEISSELVGKWKEMVAKDVASQTSQPQQEQQDAS